VLLRSKSIGPEIIIVAKSEIRLWGTDKEKGQGRGGRREKRKTRAAM